MKMAVDVQFIADAIRCGAYTYAYNLVASLLKRKNISLELAYFDKNKERGHRKIIDEAFGGYGDFIHRECNDHKSLDFFGELNYFRDYNYGDCLKINSKISHFLFERRVCEPTLYKQDAVVTIFDTLSLDINFQQHYFKDDNQQKLYREAIIRKDRIERTKPLQIITDSNCGNNSIRFDFT